MARYTIIPSVNLVLEKGNKILLGRRFNTGFADGLYSTPGGHLEPEESLHEGLKRESLEELGINIYDIKLKALVNVKHSNRVHFFFSAKSDDEPVNKEIDKCDDLSWFDKLDLPKNTLDYVRDVILGKDYIELD